MRSPFGLVRGTGGALFGVSYEGGTLDYGSLYRLDPGTGAGTQLASFSLVTGGHPSPHVVADEAGNVFGLSGYFLWRWNSESGLIQVGDLHEAQLAPRFGIVSDGTGGLIGIGADTAGDSSEILWRWRQTTGVQRLAVIGQNVSEYTTRARLASDGQGTVYGFSDTRTLWRWNAAGGLQNLSTLSAAEVGGGMLGSISVDAIGQVWGTTLAGGAFNGGTLWRWTQAGGVIKLADFNPNLDGRGSGIPVMVTPTGAAYGLGPGAIWMWTSSGGLTRVAGLAAFGLGSPDGPSVMDENGAIFATSPYAQNGGPGSIWKWSPATGLTKLNPFNLDAWVDSYDWHLGVAKDAQGRLYGVTRSNIAVRQETLWRWSPAAGYEKLGVFKDSNAGRFPSPPAIDAAGNVFGVAAEGGTNNRGTLWRWNAGSGLLKLAEFPGNLGGPGDVIVLGQNGQIYGTRRGYTSPGAIWKWTAETGIVDVASLTSSGGDFSPSPLTETNGPWLGISAVDGGSYPHTLWSWSESAGFETLFTFPTNQLAYPRPSVVRDSAGNIYGVGNLYTQRLWKWNPASGLTLLPVFDPLTTGSYPQTLCMDANGVIRGTCASGGAYGAGTIWTWREGGELCAIHHFNPQSAGPSYALGLDVDAEGNLSGVSRGLLWRFTNSPPPSAPTVATGAVLENNGFEAILPGTVDASGAQANVWVEYGTNPDELTQASEAAPSIVSGPGPHAVTATITGISNRRVYFARIVASNSQGTTAGNIVAFTVPNAPPRVVEDRLHGPPSGSGSFLIDVLANDNGGGDELQIDAVSQGYAGQTAVEAGKIRYTPNANFQGSDSFSYSVRTQFGGYGTAYVTIYNYEPSFADDIAIYEGGPLIHNPLANDSDPDGDALAIQSVTQPAHGTVTFTTAEITYTPNAGFQGTDRFTYTITDGRVVRGTARVELRPSQVLLHEKMSVGTVIPSAGGDMVVSKFGAPGSLGDGLILARVKYRGRMVKALLDTSKNSVVFRSGELAPGSNETFVKSVSEPSGRAFLVTLTTNSPVFAEWKVIAYYDGSNPAIPIARTGDEIEGFGVVESFSGFAESNGSVFILAGVRSPEGQLRQALWVWKDGVPDGLILSGLTTVFEKQVESVATMVPVPGSPAGGRWVNKYGQIVARLTYKDGTQSIAILQAEHGPLYIAETDDTSPLGEEYIRFGLPALSDESFAFRSSERLPPQKPYWSIFGKTPGSWVDWVTSEDLEKPVWGGSAIKRLMNPLAGDLGKVAFLADVTRLGWTKQSLVWFDGSSANVVARDGDPLPGEDAGLLGRIKSFVLPSKSSRGPIFTAGVPGGVGLFACNEAGKLLTLAKPGMTLILGGVSREITSVRALEGTSGPARGARGYDEFGRVEAIVKFADGGESLIYFSLP